MFLYSPEDVLKHWNLSRKSTNHAAESIFRDTLSQLEAQRFITTFTRACHWSPSLTQLIRPLKSTHCMVKNYLSTSCSGIINNTALFLSHTNTVNWWKGGKQLTFWLKYTFWGPKWIQCWLSNLSELKLCFV
jgi:hypothetical protein